MRDPGRARHHEPAVRGGSGEGKGCLRGEADKRPAQGSRRATRVGRRTAEPRLGPEAKARRSSAEMVEQRAVRFLGSVGFLKHVRRAETSAWAAEPAAQPRLGLEAKGQLCRSRVQWPMHEFFIAWIFNILKC